MTTLRDLEAVFMRVESPGHHREVDSMAEAHGVRFLCPQCHQSNGGPVGTHSIIVWFRGRGAPDDEWPAARWQASGASLGDLTLSPSIHVVGDWHGWIRNGKVQ